MYYGSEWGAEAVKTRGSDDNLRPAFDAPQWNGLTDQIAAMAKVHKGSDALCQGDFEDMVLTNLQTVFRRRTEKETVLVCVNIDENPYFAHLNAGTEKAVDLLTGKRVPIGGGVELPPYSAMYLRLS